MKISNIKKKTLTLLTGALLTGNLCANEYVPAWEKFADWKWGDAMPTTHLPPFTGRPAHNKNLWLGEEDFAATINGGWNDDGLVFFIDVVDKDVENNNPDNELWKGDSCEIYITSATNKHFTIGHRLQVIIAAPDESGNCRVAFYADDPQTPAEYFKATGTRTANGYTITAFVPWPALGKGAKEMLLQDGFRFNMHIDDFEGCIMSLNGRIDVNHNTEASPAVKPVENIADGSIWDISPRRQVITPLIISGNNGIEFDAGEPCTFILRDEFGKRVTEKYSSTGFISYPAPDAIAGRMDIVTENNGVKLLSSVLIMAYMNNFDAAVKSLQQPEKPVDRITTLGVINALECIKSLSQLDDVPNELAWRLCKFKGEDVSNAPAPLCFLNLTGDPAGLVQVGIGRRGPVNFIFTGSPHKYSTLTVQWGGIPVVYADILCFEDAASAQAAVASFRHMRHQLPVELPEADAVYAGHGFIPDEGIPGDMDPEHLVSVFDPAAPAVVTRVNPEIALEYSGAKAFVVREGANPEHITIMKNAGLQEITAAEAAKTDAPVIHLGIEGLNVPIRGKSYRHTRYGVPDDMIIACKGNIAVQTSFAVPEMAKEVIKAVFDRKPVSEETVDRWRQMRLDSLGGDLPEFRALGRLVRTGDTHTHTLYSDGGSTPGTLLAEAIAGGMDFMILTDHDTIAGAEKMSKVLTETSLDFPFITGCELTMNDAYHLNVFPLKKLIDKTGKSHAELIAEARAQGAVVMLNHPMKFGLNLRKFWYTSLAGSGIDAVERNLEQREVWRQNGYEGAFLGSTDTHYGVFGHMERSVFLLEEVTGEAIAEEVIAKRCGMIAPDLPGFVYGSEDVCNAVRAALGDPELPEYHGKRLDKTFAEFDLQKFLEHKVDGNDVHHEWGWQGNAGEITTIIPER